MISHVATYSLIEEEDSTTKGWLSSMDYQEKHDIPTSKWLLVALEVLLGAGAITLLVLSQQTWPEGFWLNHSAVFIASSVATGLVCLDILIAIGIRTYAGASNHSPPQDGQESNRAQPINALSDTEINAQRNTWLQKVVQFWNDFNDRFCFVLAKQGLNHEDYKLIIFRPAIRSRPGLFTNDGVAPDFNLMNSPNKDRLNLRNYEPSSILVVTYYDEHNSRPIYEDIVIENPCGPEDDLLTPGNAAKVSYMGDQYIHVHLNEHDVELLHKEAKLSPKIIDIIRNKRNFASTRAR